MDEESQQGRVVAPSEAKELKRWDLPKRAGGMNADGYEPFPRMLYKAQKNPLSQKYEVAIDRDVISLDKTTVILDAEQFNATCQQIVRDQRGHEMAHADGWRDSQAEAMAYYEGFQTDMAQAAAERAYQDRNMSEKARAEAGVADASTAQHVAEIPQKPTDPALAQRKREAMAKARAAKAARKAASVA